MGGEETRKQLIEAMLTAIAEVGFAGVSARVVARHADVNQALIFYHFDSMAGLVAAACRHATAERVAVWVPELEQVQDLPSLIALARRLHDLESREGNVAVLAQALAASHSDPALGQAVGEALELWLAPLQDTARRILTGTVLEGVLAPGDIARTVAAAFVGVELFEGVVSEGGGDTFDVLERLAVIGSLALEAGPITRAAVRRRLRAAEGRGR